MKIVDVANPDPEKQFAPCERMANAMVEIIRKKGGCLPQDLNARGFSPKEVADLWDMSKTLVALMMEP